MRHMQHDCNGSVAAVVVVVVVGVDGVSAVDLGVTVDDIEREFIFDVNKYEKFCKFCADVCL